MAVEIEPVLEPEREIIDPHHHLWDRPDHRYLADELARDLNSGHRIAATVFVQCRSSYFAHAPAALQPVGETRFVAEQHERAAALTAADVCAGIIGYADLRLGVEIEPVLDAHLSEGKGRFRGIRQILAWDASPEVVLPGYEVGPDIMEDASFRAGFASLSRKSLVFDALVFHPQLPDLAKLAAAFPDVSIILNHAGLPLSVGPYSGRSADVTAAWQQGMSILAECPNVFVKLGGFAMPLVGLAATKPEEAEAQPRSAALADIWAPYFHQCIDLFGPARCMFESNFPVERLGGDYRAIWNAFKRIARPYSEAEKQWLFAETARKAYRLA
ncbi:amidohydrolase family protein [Rhodoligotrophos ferricapiens]|uniref:amidohydrolase family protein n=1 Tax=Rhodoligotrophos ferricapiens TaxID=3069264 RepID=UPI00315C7E27